MRPNRNILEKLQKNERLTRSQWGKQEASLKTAQKLGWGVKLENGGYVVEDSTKLDLAIQRIAIQEAKEEKDINLKISQSPVQYPKSLAVATTGDAHRATKSTPYIDCQFKEGAFQGSLRLPEETIRLRNKEVILIENAEPFRESDRIFPRTAFKIYYGGKIPSVLIQCIAQETQKVWLAPDYDVVGMQQWKTLREKIPAARLWMVDDLEELFHRHGKVIQGWEPDIIRRIEPRIGGIVDRTKKVLQQEALFQQASLSGTKP